MNTESLLYNYRKQWRVKLVSALKFNYRFLVHIIISRYNINYGVKMTRQKIDLNPMNAPT